MKRILFVDDERRILDGLQRTLRPYRKQWEMTFAISGSEALAILAAGNYDVIVTDMRMPQMDGAQLLEIVRHLYPGMIRIILSGHSDVEAAVRAVPVAHQFLSKPCDHAKLQAAIDPSNEYDSIVSDDATRRVIAAIGELPTMPATYATLMAALDDPEVSLDRISGIVERDMAVVAKVLQLVNSAFFGITSQVATVSAAVGFLGFDLLKHLVITVELFRTFAPVSHVAGFSTEEIQRHSCCVGSIASRLPIPRKKADSTSVAALLHDIGKLVLAVRLPGQFERALQASLAQNRPLYLLEEEMTGTTHAEIGAYLLGLWGIPPSVVDAVSRHHHPIRSAEDEEMDISLALHVADLLEHEAAGQKESVPPHAIEEISKDWLEWNHALPEWRKMAEEIVRCEAQCR
jgi:putative nucleotidyltransferase with HDIG domain